MATKNISISVEAYERLKMIKDERESFTDVINRITRKKPIMEFAGILSEEEGNALENYIKGRRKSDRREKISRMLK